MESKRIALVGSGRMAHNLSKGLLQANHRISHLIARPSKKAQELAKNISAQSIDIEGVQLEDFDVDLILLAVSDEAIETVSHQFSEEVKKHIPIAHTSASTPMESLKEFNHFGVFYPFQTMTIGREVIWKEIPIIVESNSPYLEKSLLQLAGSLSEKYEVMSLVQRKSLHLAGVFVNNFTNHLIHLAENHLKENNINPKLTHALLQETMLKVMEIGPDSAQTGPAIRGDHRTMKVHLDQLENKKSTALIYELLSKSIQQLNPR